MGGVYPNAAEQIELLKICRVVSYQGWRFDLRAVKCVLIGTLDFNLIASVFNLVKIKLKIKYCFNGKRYKIQRFIFPCTAVCGSTRRASLLDRRGFFSSCVKKIYAEDRQGLDE